MPVTGKEIFDNLVEYPLPERDGIKDYIFYFVSVTKDYGLGAKNFFDKHYSNHIQKSVKSLEALINVLDSEIKSKNLNQIREIVIVSHGTEVTLNLPLIDDIDESEEQPKNLEYKFLSVNSLALLQDDFKNNKHTSFAQKRKAVLSKLKKDSWITIRACQFGYSKQGLYAFFSFFGGYSNVYAPMAWQFFGYSPVGENMKFESKLDVYEHLLKQRFLKGRQHSPQRVEKIARQFMNPGKSREPFILATQKIRDTITDEMLQYESIIDNLDKQKITADIREKFKAEALELSENPNIKVKEKNRRWEIKDRIKGSDGEFYLLSFDLIEELETAAQSLKTATLKVYAQLSESRSSSSYIPIQLLFLKSDNDTWRAYMFDLISCPDEPGVEAKKQEYDQVVGLLNNRKLSNTSVNIRQLFEENSLDLPNTAVITVVLPGKKWLIEDSSDKYLIKQENSYVDETTLYLRLAVYKHFTDKHQELAYQNEVLSHIGADIDCPGTELMAYLDNYTIEELIDFINYLRKPYRPENVIYLSHAYQAIFRKSGYFKWSMQTYGNSTDPLAGLDFDLSLSERTDKWTLYYDYSPNNYWREVKASNPPKKAFSQDLFLEETLKYRLPSGFKPDELEIDSPNSNIEELRHFESERAGLFFEVEKSFFDPVEEDIKPNCEEFGQMLALMKEYDIKDFDLSKLEAKIRGVIDEANPIWEAVKKAKTVYDWTYGFYKKLEFIFKYLHSPIAFAEGTGAILVGSEVIMASRLPLLARLKYIKGAFGAMLFTEVIGMMIEFVLVSEEAAKSWEQRGKIVGVRIGASRLIDLSWYTINEATTTPTLVDGQPISLPMPDYEAAELEDSGHPFMWAPDRYKKGYLLGSKAFQEQANKIFAELDQYIDDLLWKEGGLSTCHILKLRASGLIDFKKLKAIIMKDMAYEVLDKFRHGKKPPSE